MRYRPFVLASLVVAAAAAHARPAAANSEWGACVFHQTPQVVTYWTDADAPGIDRAHDLRCDQPSLQCHLKGWVMRPAGSAPRPTAVFIHGSGSTFNVHTYCFIANAFLDRGFVVFMPVGRGVQDTSSETGGGFANTGWLTEDWAAYWGGSDADHVIAVTLDYMKNEDVWTIDDALGWIKARSYVDASEVALLGHSYGGAKVTLAAAAALAHPPAAVVSLSGAAMSWNGSWRWGSELNDAATHHRVPILFQREMAESPQWWTGGTSADIVASAVQPFSLAVSHGTGPARLALYTAYLPDAAAMQACLVNNPNYQCSHGHFVTDFEGVKRWIDAVVDFLADQGIE